MSVFIDQNTKVVVQGASPTSQGLYHALKNKAYGTQVVAGTNPKRAGEVIEGIPVYATVAEAVEETGANASFIAVPPSGAPSAILEAAEAGIPFIVCITEFIPAQDEARVYSTLVRDFPEARLLGPNCPGIISPGKANIGITADSIVMPGPVGLVSRSGTIFYQALYELTQQGVGQTTGVGIGGDPVPGTNFIDCLAAFEEDPETKAIILIGEIKWVTPKERAADFIKSEMTKPVVAYIAGMTAPEGRKMGHAGAITSGNVGTAKGKMATLTAAGAMVVNNPTEAAARMVEVVKGL